ncbi:MAG: DUF1203 domain-containing protein [Gemmatimonadaceae bacterium]
MQSFQLVGLSPNPFESYFSLTDSELANMGARRVIAQKNPGYPCRISLVDAEPGEELLLLPYRHQPANSPYESSGPIYVRRGATQHLANVGEIPEYVMRRLISVRGYDAADMMIEADVCEGPKVAVEIERQLHNAEVRYIHLHNAKRGCFSCLVQRV